MAAKKPAKKSTTTKRAAAKAATSGGSTKGFTPEERAAMRDRAREMKAGADSEGDRAAVVEKIAAMPPADRAIAERLHAIIGSTAPELAPRLWYGMPAYAKDGKVVCFFQSAQKFKTRYSTLGFSDQAKLDDGEMWPTGFAVKELTAAGEARVRELVKRAVR
jgi:uncharacterized protein YdhG (YjbR/CyaY superfamily)